MPVRKIPLVPDIAYHIFNRGRNKQQIFFTYKDYQRFISTLERYKKEYPNIQILSYCLLPNHFHFVLRTVGEGFEISDFMNRIQQSYAIHFRNIEPGLKTGPVFEGRFKAKPIESESYLAKVISYVNYNPLKHHIIDRIEDYPWTSYHSLSQDEKDALMSTDIYGLEGDE